MRNAFSLVTMEEEQEMKLEVGEGRDPIQNTISIWDRVTKGMQKE